MKKLLIKKKLHENHQSKRTNLKKKLNSAIKIK